MQLSSEWLQYGAFGLLAAMLVAIGWFIKKWISQTAAHDEKTQLFLHELIERAGRQQDLHAEAWQAMLEKALVAFAKSAETMAKVDVSLAAHSRQMEQNNKAILEKLAHIGVGKEE